MLLVLPPTFKPVLQVAKICCRKWRVVLYFFITTSVHVARFNGATSSPRFPDFFCNRSLSLVTNQITTSNEHLTSFSLSIKYIIFSKRGRHNLHYLKIVHDVICFLLLTSSILNYFCAKSNNDPNNSF